MTLWKKQNQRDRKQISSYLGVRGSRKEDYQVTPNFWSNELLTVVMITGRYAFVKTQNYILKRVSFTVYKLYINF